MKGKVEDEASYLDVNAVAKRIGYSPRRVRTFLGQKKLKGVRLPGGRKWLIRQCDIVGGLGPKTEESQYEEAETHIDVVALQSKKEHFEDLAIVACSLLEDGLDNVIINDGDKQSTENKYTMIQEHKDVEILKRDLYLYLLANTDITIRKFSQFDVDCLFSHLMTEYTQIEEIGYSVFIETDPFELIKILRIVSRRKTFKGTCPVCAEW